MSVGDGVASTLNGSYSIQSSHLRLMSFSTLPSPYESSFSSSSPSYWITSTSSSVSDTEIEFVESGQSFSGHNAVAMVLIVLILMIIIVGTIIGNILVCVAVCLVRKLRRPYNYLLVSLAVSDLCVAILVMPMALLHELLGEWQFGRMACDLWVSFDVLSCTASILNLCMISVDRYLAITKPLEYGVKRTPKRMVAYILFVWIGAACISVPPVLILGNEHGDGSICQVCQNFWYQICATFGSFYIPLTVMVTVYYKIFQAAKRIVDEEKKAQVHLRLVKERGKKSSFFLKPSFNCTSKKKNSPPPSSNQTPRRCSVVQINNGEVETKLAPLLPDLEGGSSKGVWGSERGITQNNHLNRQPPPPYPKENIAFKNIKNGNQLLDVPMSGDGGCHYGGISPMSTITTCESNWSLIPCTEEGLEMVQVGHITKGGDFVPKNTLHIEGSGNKSSTFHSQDDCKMEKDDCLGCSNVQCNVIVNSLRDDQPRISEHFKNTPLTHEGENYKVSSYNLQQNSYTKIPLKDNKSSTKEKSDDPSTETLLNKPDSGNKKSERRKSSGENNSPKKRFLNPPKSKLRITLAKERKASTTLGIIMSAFIICWLPFFVLAIIRPFLVESAIPNSISSLFLWLGYANSLLNPIIYATLNKDFRKPFQEILCLRCSSLNILMREEFYYSQYGPETPNHSHIRSSALVREPVDIATPVTPGIEKCQLDSYDECITESRF